jgi:hypothetical protein
MEEMVISDGIPAVPRNRKLSEFLSEPFRGRENDSEFLSVEQIQKTTLGIPFRTLQRKRTQLGIPFRTLQRKRKQLGIPFRTIPRKRKLLRTKRGSPKFQE